MLQNLVELNVLYQPHSKQLTQVVVIKMLRVFVAVFGPKEECLNNIDGPFKVHGHR